MRERLLGTRFVAGVLGRIVATFDDRATENIGDLLLLVIFGSFFASLVDRLT